MNSQTPDSNSLPFTVHCLDVGAKSIPKGYRNKAQGCDSYPGIKTRKIAPTPKGLRNPFRVRGISCRYSWGSSATPGYLTKARWAFPDAFRIFCAHSCILPALLFLVSCEKAAEDLSLNEIPSEQLRVVLKGYDGDWRTGTDQARGVPAPPSESILPPNAVRILVV